MASRVRAADRRTLRRSGGLLGAALALYPPPMRAISLINLFVGLNDLLTKRLTALQSFAAGIAIVKVLTAQRDLMAKLPAVVAGRPLVEELDAADDRHDALGYALWHILEAYLLHPDTPPALIEAAKKIRAAFIPTLQELVASYPAEAKAAMDRKPDLENLKAELSLFPVAAGGATLYDWATSFLAAGTAINGLLSARADIDAKGRKDAARLRSETVGILNRLRKSLADESKHDKTLPADLDAQVFGYLDLLEKTSADARAQGKAEPAPPEASAPVVPVVGDGP
jgi:hypothetical protein